MIKYICKFFTKENKNYNNSNEDHLKIIFKGFLRNFGGIYYENEKDDLMKDLLMKEFSNTLKLAQLKFSSLDLIEENL